MKHLALVILLALAPLSWGETYLSCTGVHTTPEYYGSELRYRDTNGEANLVLQNEKIPFWVKINGWEQHFNVRISTDGKRYIANGPSSEGGFAYRYGFNINRENLQVLFSRAFLEENSTRDNRFQGQCKVEKIFGPRI